MTDNNQPNFRAEAERHNMNENTKQFVSILPPSFSSKIVTISSIVVIIIAALIIVKIPVKINADGQISVQERADIPLYFDKKNYIVEKIHKTSNDYVAIGDPLISFRALDADFQQGIIDNINNKITLQDRELWGQKKLYHKELLQHVQTIKNLNEQYVISTDKLEKTTELLNIKVIARKNGLISKDELLFIQEKHLDSQAQYHQAQAKIKSAEKTVESLQASYELDVTRNQQTKNTIAIELQKQKNTQQFDLVSPCNCYVEHIAIVENTIPFIDQPLLYLNNNRYPELKANIHIPVERYQPLDHATVHIEVLNYPKIKYGTLNAKVIHVAQTPTIVNGTLGYSAQLQLDGHDFPLANGMPVKAEIKTDELRLYQLLIKEFTQ
jgi:multidrug efflux pump subunit AcrA (membrane-fusion protein)